MKSREPSLARVRRTPTSVVERETGLHVHDVASESKTGLLRGLHARHARVDVTRRLRGIAHEREEGVLRRARQAKHLRVGFHEDGGPSPTHEVVRVAAEETVVGADVHDEGRETEHLLRGEATGAFVASSEIPTVSTIARRPGGKRLGGALGEEALEPAVEPRRLAALRHVDAEGLHDGEARGVDAGERGGVVAAAEGGEVDALDGLSTDAGERAGTNEAAYGLAHARALDEVGPVADVVEVMRGEAGAGGEPRGAGEGGVDGVQARQSEGHARARRRRRAGGPPSTTGGARRAINE